jgi:hypothetical protein
LLGDASNLWSPIPAAHHKKEEQKWSNVSLKSYFGFYEEKGSKVQYKNLFFFIK